MSEVHRLVARAAARLLAVRMVSAAVRAVFIAVIAIIAVRIAERLFAFSIDWWTAWGLAIGVAVVGSAAWTVIRRHDRLAVARELDERAGLKETISTAMFVQEQNDPWSRASVDRAREVSRRVVVRQAFPFSVPRVWPAPILGVGIFFLLGLIPRADLLQMLAKSEAKQETQRQVEQAKAEVQAADKKLEELLAKIDQDALKNEELDANEPTEPPTTPDEIRREAIKKLTTLQDRLNDINQGEKMAAFRELTDRLEQLREPRNPLPQISAMVRNLQLGNFKQAQEELAKLEDQLKSGQLTPEQREQLAKQLEELAKQLEELAKQQEELEKALAEAGLDPNLANNPAALAAAIDAMQGLTDEQKERLKELAKKAAKASEMCNNMAGACRNCAGACSGEGGEESGEASLSELGDQLAEMGLSQEEAEALEAAMREAEAQAGAMGMCMNPGAGQCQSQNPSANPFASLFAGQGRGAGVGHAKVPVSEHDVEFESQKRQARVRTNDGPVIATMVDYGEQIRGESVQAFRQAVASGSSSAAEAIETMAVPREYHGALKYYFGTMEQKAGPAPTPAAPPATPPAPAPDASR